MWGHSPSPTTAIWRLRTCRCPASFVQVASWTKETQAPPKGGSCVVLRSMYDVLLRAGTKLSRQTHSNCKARLSAGVGLNMGLL